IYFLLYIFLFIMFIFFFQAEDGIRDFHVTGVQTCALPIYDIGYKGIPSGYSFNEGAIDYNPSAPNNNTAVAPMKNIIMTYAEIEFIKAELSFKGLITGDAETHFKQGTEAAMDIWNIAMPTNYFDNEKTA